VRGNAHSRFTVRSYYSRLQLNFTVVGLPSRNLFDFRLHSLSKVVAAHCGHQIICLVPSPYLESVFFKYSISEFIDHQSFALCRTSYYYWYLSIYIAGQLFICRQRHSRSIMMPSSCLLAVCIPRMPFEVFSGPISTAWTESEMFRQKVKVVSLRPSSYGSGNKVMGTMRSKMTQPDRQLITGYP